MIRCFLICISLASCFPCPSRGAEDRGIPAGASPTFRDPLTRDPMMAKSLSMMSPGMGHFYNGNLGKMKKYQRRMVFAHFPFVLGLGLDIGRDTMKGVDQWKDLKAKNFPWYSLGGFILSGVFGERVREKDAEEAYSDALKLRMGPQAGGDSPAD